jgi:hypothetical protein
MRAALIAAAALVVFAPAAGASSIVYVKGGNVYRAAPGGRARLLVRAPGAAFFQGVTQDDRGRIWAVHYPSRKWQRFSAHGRRVGRPFNTAGTGLGLQYDLGRNLPGFVGPLDPQVSSDGRLLGSWGILDEVTFINPHPLPGEPTHDTKQTAGASVIFSSRDAIAVGQAGAQLGELGWPSWLGVPPGGPPAGHPEHGVRGPEPAGHDPGGHPVARRPPARLGRQGRRLGRRHPFRRAGLRPGWPAPARARRELS